MPSRHVGQFKDEGITYGFYRRPFKFRDAV